jgi:hypothetical protein
MPVMKFGGYCGNLYICLNFMNLTKNSWNELIVCYIILFKKLIV